MKEANKRSILVDDLLIILAVAAIWGIALICINVKYSVVELTQAAHAWGISSLAGNVGFLQFSICLLILIGLLLNSWMRYYRDVLVESQNNYKTLCNKYMNLQRDYDEYNRKVITQKLKDRGAEDNESVSDREPDGLSSQSLSDDIDEISSFMRKSGLQ